MLTWADLAARTLARQFPAELEPGDVAGLIDLVGPIQSQTARSVFIGSAARLPGVTRQQITDAYTSGAIVRGSTDLVGVSWVWRLSAPGLGVVAWRKLPRCRADGCVQP